MSATVAIAGTGSGRSKYPFTTTQWHELEHQALIYKYMSSGIPIPPDLLFSLKSTLHSNSFFPYQSSPLGWNPYQMGYGKKIDPEPGRCRRTDGKKWRCAKEAYPDSKYCERHMHRGKNRSRKPVESPLTNNSTNTNSSVSVATTNSLNVASNSSNNPSVFTNKNPSNSSMYSFSCSDSSYNSTSTNAHLLYPGGSGYTQKDYRDRYYQGLKDEAGELSFLKDNSISTTMGGGGFPGSQMDGNWPLVDKQSNGYPNYLQQSNNNNNNRDFNCELSMKIEEQRSNLSEKTTHHFFDEWPIKTNDDSLSTTQLSISIPSSNSNHHDFFLSNSRNN